MAQKIPKFATESEAEQVLRDGSFVYHNPCCVCGKECSTPTKEIWLNRITLFGSVHQMYTEYKCRKCRKGDKPERAATKIDVQAKAAPPTVALAVAPDPMRQTAREPAIMRRKEDRPLVQIKPEPRQFQPGDFLAPRDGQFAFSIWENGVHIGTDWHRFNKVIEERFSTQKISISS